ncbi:MAG: RIP metalloprotease RseP [Sulfitobacter sp.]
MDILGLIPQFGSLIWIIVAFVVALSVIVAIHEYGHYIVGRWTGIKADVFSLGFGPVLWSRPDKHGTRWQIAALPFGGYVKFAGDANAASGKDEAAMAEVADNPEALRHTMHGAPLWARSLTVAAGPVFNFIFSILVFFAIAMTSGVEKEPLTVGEMRALPNFESGLQSGDEIIAVAGVPVPDFTTAQIRDDFFDSLPKQRTLEYDVIRDGQEQTVSGPFWRTPYISLIQPLSAAYSAGLETGDVITAIDGVEIFDFEQIRTAVEGSGGATVALKVWRGGETLDFNLTPKITDQPQDDGSYERKYLIGIGGGRPFEAATERPGVGEALWGGATSTWRIIETSLSGLKQMIVGNISTCNLSGPLGIAKTSGAMASQGAQSFVFFIAFLSTAVGLLNLFPIPALDGGHLVFYAYEAVSGKPPSDGALRILMSIGLAMVLTLMVFALGTDIFCP